MAALIVIPIFFLLAGGFLMAYSVKKIENWSKSPSYIVGAVWVAYGVSFIVVNYIL